MLFGFVLLVYLGLELYALYFLCFMAGMISLSKFLLVAIIGIFRSA